VDNVGVMDAAAVRDIAAGASEWIADTAVEVDGGSAWRSTAI
jgi:hypothetical protein